MSIDNASFLIFLITILATRIFLYFKPIASPTIGGFRIHHYMYGILLAVFGLLAKNVWLFAIGLGLFVDELTYLLIGGKNHQDNYSIKSLVGTLVFTILVFIFRHQISSFLW